MASKGKGVMADGKDSYGAKRKNRDVLQFFEDAADEVDGSDDDVWSDFLDDEDLLGDFEEPKVRSGPEKGEQVPLFPKEEELSGDELEKMLEERYRTRSGFVRYAEDDYDNKTSVDKSFFMPSAAEPIIWKVKCKTGREKNVVFCLIQKFVDLKVLGTKLHIISAFAVEHIKGFVFVEAEKQSDVTEACYQLADVYCTLVFQVPLNEVGQVLNVRRKNNDVKEGTWARVKNGVYRGDLTQVVAFNKDRKRATVKLIPRVDMQALMEKYSGGSKSKRPKREVPTARLISSRELEELRPLMQYRRDRDTGKVFEFLDGLMLKDGFLFKKMSVDSLGFWNVNPTEDELQKFALPVQDESDNVEWLSQLYGEKEKKCDVQINTGGGKGGKGGGKGEGSSGSNDQSGFEVHDLVTFGKRDFGVVIGMDKDEKYKIVKDGFEGPVTLTLGQKDLKYVPVDKKFTALDHCLKTISINDAVKILDGPSKDKQGIVKQIYRGVIFVYDENDLENAYFSSKSKMSEKIKHSACLGKDEGGPSTFEDATSSPKSPLSKPWQMKDSSDDREKGEVFSVGQSLRIRVGPLKGYLCRVLAVRYSEVTVKLNSKQKVLTVKHEHLSEVRDKSSTVSTSDDSGFGSSFKPFEILGADGSANDWLQGAGASGSTGGDGWKLGSSNDGSSWAAVSAWGSSAQDTTTVNNDSKKEDDWLTKTNSNQNNNTGSAWGKSEAGASGGGSSWGKKPEEGGSDGGSAWGKSKAGGSGGGSAWGKPEAGGSSGGSAWGKSEAGGNSGGSFWGKPEVGGSSGGSAWGKPEAGGSSGGSTWGKPEAGGSSGGSAWGKPDSGGSSGGSAWGKPDVGGSSGGSAWGKPDVGGSSGGSAWGKPDAGGSSGGSAWGKPDAGGSSGGSAWGKSEAGGGSSGGSAWGKPETGGSSGGSAWGKPAAGGGSILGKPEVGGSGGGSTWGKPEAGGSSGGSWGKPQSKEVENKTSEGGSSWGKPESGGSSGGSWGKPKSDEGKNKTAGGGSSWGQGDSGGSGGGAWGKSNSEGGNNKASEGGSSWGKKSEAAEGGSSWGGGPA